MKCSFCEQQLMCKNCRRPFKPRDPEHHVAVFQPDMHIVCPECQKVLICKACGFVYGQAEAEEPPAE